MNRRYKLGVLLIVCLSLLAISLKIEAIEPKLSLAEQISQMFNLETDLLVERYTYAVDEIVLWRELLEGQEQLVKNWGIILFNQGKPVDSWFYTGPLTNRFQDFYLSFRQFTSEERKELIVMGTDNNYQKWAYIFIFNLTDTQMELFWERKTDWRGDSYFIQPGL